MAIMATSPMVDWKALGVGCLWGIVLTLAFVIALTLTSIVLFLYAL